MLLDYVIWIVFLLSVFAFLSIFFWALQRRREREAYYRYELARHLLERADETDQQQFLEWLREQDAIEGRRRWEGLLLGGLVLVATGIGLLIMLHEETGEEGAVGWLPIVIGLSLLIFLGVTRALGRATRRERP